MQIEFLGIIWDTAENQMRLPEDKLGLIQKELERFQQHAVWSWESGMSLLGKLGFAAMVNPLGRLNTRYLQRASRKLVEYQPRRVKKMPAEALEDCSWWSQNLRKPGTLFVPEPTVFVTTDASDAGWGVQLGDHYLSGQWTSDQAHWHINRKELFTVYIALSKFKDMVSGKSIMLQSDNKTVVVYIKNQGETRSLILLKATNNLLALADISDITLHAFYLPGRFNSIADRLSREKLLPDWHLDDETTKKVFLKWGVPQIDLFATAQSKVVPEYASIEAEDCQARFINAFSRQWNYSLAWVFPSPPLIPRVLQHLNKSMGIFLVVAPRWEKVFWRSDLKRRALEAPFQIFNPSNHLMDLSTNCPPPTLENSCLEVWRVRVE